MKTVLQLDNDRLRFTMFEDASADILDKTHQVTWHMGPVMYQDVGPIMEDVVWPRRERYWADYYIGRFRAKAEAGGVRVEVLAPPWTTARGSCLAKFSLDGGELVLRVEEIDPHLPSLNFPPPIQSRSLVIPSNVGEWIRQDKPGMLSYFSAQNCGLNMRWVGGLAGDDDAGWMMIFEDNPADSGTYRNNLSVAPCWLKSKGAWHPTRSVRYCFQRGGYNAMAKRFRNFAIANGFFRSLREKVARTPALSNLLGGRIVSMFQASTDHAQRAEDWFRPMSEETRAGDGRVEVKISHRDAKAIVELAKSWGMKQGLFTLRGTFAGGYDERHPDIWPPEPALGTVDELKAVVAAGTPCLTALHDNYQDIYTRSPSFPGDVVQKADGSLMFGGYWHGGLCFITCPTRQVEMASRNWENVRTLGLPAYFIDTAACVQFYECYHPEHPQARREDYLHKLRLMQFYKEQGVVLGSEEAADFGLAELDYLENRHRHVPHESIPLWPLVFHDASFLARYPSGGTGGGRPAGMAENYLWGYLSYWGATNLTAWTQEKQAFQESLRLDAFHRKIGLDELVRHQYLDDGLVEQTEFSSGLSVAANFAAEPRKVCGRLIEPQSSVVLD